MRPNKIAILVTLFFCCISLQAQTADEVIAGYIAYTGGVDHWKAIKTLKTSGVYNYGGIEFPFSTYSKAPNLYKFIVPFNGKYYAQSFNVKSGWKIDAFKGQTKKTLLTGKAALAMANEADVEIESPFIDYKSKGYQAIIAGTDTAAGKSCFKIIFSGKNDRADTCYFSKEDFSLLKKQAISKNQEMEKKILDIYYTDYRQVNAVKIPFVSTMKIGNQTILTITTTLVQTNEPIADKEFK